MIPSHLATTITGVYGERGRRWLEIAPALIASARDRWRLSLEPPFPNLTYNFVAPATLSGGGSVVLKAGVPGPEIDAEIAALRQFSGHGGARLVDADPTAAVLLLERAIPGDTLDTLDDDPEETRIAARLARILWRKPPPGAPFKSLEHLFQAFDRHRARHGGGPSPLPADLLALAESLVPPLLESSPPPVLLHGDFHHHNILRSGEHDWLVIDPPGATGDPAAEFGMFLCNPHARIDATQDLHALMSARIDIIAAELGLEPDRLIRWGVVWAAMSACWHDEDNSPGIPYAVRCARAIASLL